MTKTDIHEMIAVEQKIPVSQAREIVNSVFRHIYKGLMTDGEVMIKEFGTFHRREIKARWLKTPFMEEGRMTQKNIRIFFKPSKKLK